jgi:hypothetical protein
MTIETIREMLGWCTLINMGILLHWFLIFTFARDRIHRFHGRWFRLAPERFDAIRYSGMAFYKLGIFLLNLVPYLALRIIG